MQTRDVRQFAAKMHRKTMTRAGRLLPLLLTAVSAVGCHAQSDPLKGRDGGAGAGGNGGGAGSGGAAPAGTGGAGNVGGTGNVGAGTAFPNGIGTEWKWKTGVVARMAGPYAPCGIIGTGPINFGAANPTGSEFAAASGAGVVLFYSPVTGKQVRAPYYAAGAVNGVDYSRDGTLLVVAADTGVQIVRLADGKVIFNGQPFALSTRAAALSPDGSLIAVLGWDGAHDATVFTLKLLRVSDGTSIGTFSPDAPDHVAPQFSVDGKLLVVGGMILSVPGLQVLPPSPLGFSHVAPDFAVLSPDGTKVAEGGHVIDIASGRELKAPMPGQDWLYWSAFSRDGAVYAETDNSNTNIHLWRTSDWTLIGTPTPIAFTSMALSDGADGRFFLSGDGAKLIATVHGAVGAGSAVFQVMNLPDLTAGPTIAEPGFGWSPVVFSPDGSLVMGVLGNASGVWRTADLSPLPRLPETSPPYGFLGNGMLQIYYSVFNPLDGTKLGFAIGSEMSPDGRLVVISSPSPKSSIIRLADLSTQAVIDTTALVFPLGPVWAFSRDNRFLAGAGKDPSGNPKVVVFDATSGSAVATLAGVPPIAIATTPSGAGRVAAFVPVDTGGVSDVRVWSVPDGKPLFDIKQVAKDASPEGDLPPMAFSPDGSLIASGATGIRIFQVETGAQRESLPAHFDTDPNSTGNYAGVLSLAFSATGQIASVGWDGTMRFWCSP
jgi:WD40 repeat protein